MAAVLTKSAPNVAHKSESQAETKVDSKAEKAPKAPKVQRPIISAEAYALLKDAKKADLTDEQRQQMKDYRRAQKPSRITHPLVGAKEGFPFDTVPSDYSFVTHKPLGKKQFKDGTGFLEYRAAQLKYRGQRLIDQGDKLAQKAKIDRQYGNEDTRKKAKKFTDMFAELENLKAALAAQGIDPTTLVAPAKVETAA